MLDLPTSILNTFRLFSPLFSRPMFKNAVLLFIGHILCKNRHTIADILRSLNLKNIKNFSKFHWVLSGANWDPLKGSKLLFTSLIKLCHGEIVLVLDSTIERRRGSKIQGLGRQRDAARSSKDNKVLTIGLNWLVCAMNVQLPFINRSWALPFLTILMPPERPLRSSKNRKDLNRKSRHKKLTKWSCQIAYIVRRWAGKKKKITLVADNAFACFELMYSCIRNNIGLISKIRLDARLYDFVPKNSHPKKGRKRVAGKVLPKLSELAKKDLKKWKKVKVSWYEGKTKSVFIQTGKCLWYYIGFRPVPIVWVLVKSSVGEEPVAFFSTHLSHTPKQIIERFVRRWSIESTFEEARRHLGMETQRQWSDKAIMRTTPVILASFSIVTLMAINLSVSSGEKIPVQQTSWYKKERITFSDVLSYVRMPIVREQIKSLLRKKGELKKISLEELIYERAAA